MTTSFPTFLSWQILPKLASALRLKDVGPDVGEHGPTNDIFGCNQTFEWFFEIVL